jgi:hypothetical protein
MSNPVMTSIAIAALIVGTGFANAQGTGAAREAPLTGATTQQSAPPSAGTPINRNDASPSGAPADGPKSNKSNEKMQPQGGKNQRAQDIKAGPKGATDNKSAGTSTTSSTTTDGKAITSTTGQAAAGGKLSTEQRTKITTVIKSQHVQPVTNVNFSISVGTRVPRNVGFHPLPAEIVTIYPEWRGYEFFLVSDQIIVVNPRTLEIVAVIDA